MELGLENIYILSEDNDWSGLIVRAAYTTKEEAEKGLEAIKKTADPLKVRPLLKFIKEEMDELRELLNNYDD